LVLIWWRNPKFTQEGLSFQPFFTTLRKPCPQHGNTGDEMLTHVDKALYKAKEAGRNKVILYAPGT
jgi:GGDEF domain-containing protein